MVDIAFTAPPTCSEFMKSNSFGRLIAGPVGSGKTTSAIFELLRRACEQAPAPDGLRHTRFAIVRQTLQQLKDTVLKDILTWLPKVASYKVSEKTIHIEVGDVRSEWMLIPLDDLEDQQRLLSSQLTGAWMSECIEMEVGLIPAISGRCGRYPSAVQGGASWFGIIADTNMPSEGSPWHIFMAQNTPIDWQIFIQPGGMSDEAENLDWLLQTPETLKLPLGAPARLAQGRTYYERLTRSNGPDWIRRYVHAQFGDDPSGTAVFRETFKKLRHVKDELTPVPTYPLLIGQDFGRDPCSIICQLNHRGQLLVLEEILAEDIGLEIHLNRSLRPVITKERYLGHSVVVIGDPSGGARSSIYEETTFDVVKRAGFNAYPAPTNDIDPRLRAVDAFLLMDEGFFIDASRCPETVRALEGGYRYGKTRAGVRKPTPDKNKYSHIMDALQYAALAAHGGLSNYITARIANKARHSGPRPRASAGGWT